MFEGRLGDPGVPLAGWHLPIVIQAGGLLTRHVLPTIRLALPVMIARAGLLVMTTVDTVMCGRLNAEEIAFYGIAQLPQMALLLVGVGLLMGVVVVTAQLDGAGRRDECGRIWRLGLLNALAAGLLVALLLWPGEWVLQLLGQDTAMAAGGGAAVTMFAFGMPAIFLFTASSGFLEGISRPLPGMVVMALANVLNAALNAVLMFGPLEMGAEGAALATSITRWAMAVVLAGYILLMPGRRAYGVTLPMAGYWRLQGRLGRLGWPMALSFALEHGAFFAAAMFAGWLGAISLAAYHIVLNTMALVYMLAIGIAVATGVRVGNAVGIGDPSGIKQAGWVGVGIGVVTMLTLMPLLALANETIVAFYTDDRMVIQLAATGLLIASWILVSDASQGILIGALRGAADIWPSLLIQTVSFWFVAIPLCYFFAFYAKYNIYGLLFGLFFGLTTAGLLLGWRFVVLTRRDVRMVS
ncbi:MAG: MATE family efflux transporter [Geminicoccaceae bacterium]